VARPKKASAELASIDDCNEALHELLLITLKLEGLTADRDRERAAVDARFEGLIDTATARKKDLDMQLQQYYMAHLDQVEKDGKRSLGLYWGVIGRRMSPPALKLLNKSWTWRTVLIKLREKFGDRFIRTKDPEVDKDLVKAELDDARLRECGLKLDQDEAFFAEPDRAKKAEA
jgi:phage host-nuclease inhibitor protein Gam